MTRFLFLRHGESTWNALRRWQGSADAPLSPRGEEQARAAGAVIGAHGPFAAVFTSTLQRARRTGELLAEVADLHLGEAFAGLAERSAGAWEGLTRVEIEAQWPGALERGAHPPGYEPDADVLSRALPVLDELALQHPGEQLLIVSHGGVIHVLERLVAGTDQPWQRLDNLEGRWFEHSPGGIDVVGERVSVLLDDTHVPAIDEGYV